MGLKKPETIDNLSMRVSAIKISHCQLSRRVDRLAEKVRAVDEKEMNKLVERQTDLAELLQIMIEKQTVVTETAYSIRRTEMTEERRVYLLSAVIYCIDQPDVWWKAGKNMSVKEWTERCSQVFAKRPKNSEGILGFMSRNHKIDPEVFGKR